MNQRSWLCLLLAGGMLLSIEAAQGQDRTRRVLYPPDDLHEDVDRVSSGSHRLIDPPSNYPLNDIGVSARIRDFAKQSADKSYQDDLYDAIQKNRELLQNLTKQGAIDQGTLERLRKTVSTDARFKDPKYRDEIKKAVATNTLTPEQKEIITKAVAPPPDVLGPTQHPSGIQSDHLKSMADAALERNRARSGVSGNGDWLNHQAAQRLNALLQNIDRHGSLRNSESLRELVRKWTSGDPEAHKWNSHNPTGIDFAAGVGRVGKYLSDDHRSANLNGIDHLPSAPDLPSASVSGPSVGSGMMLLWLLAGVLLLTLIWRLGGSLLMSQAHTSDGWRLGPWPVDPRQVASRGELVKAFEYLACRLLGPEALHRHHRDLAEQMAAIRPTPARRAALAGLEILYEQARYAPPDEPLPESCLADARRDLSLLAEALA
jgi:hypothetical protein